MKVSTDQKFKSTRYRKVVRVGSWKDLLISSTTVLNSKRQLQIANICISENVSLFE